jgi:ferredoxin-fold anticodon binding domain-containing protein
VSELVELANELPVVNQINSEDIHDCGKQDDQMLITDVEIIDMLTGDKDNEDDDDLDEITPKISYTDGLKAIEEKILLGEKY